MPSVAPTDIGRPLKYQTPELLQQAIDAYYADCERRQAPLTMSGLAYALDMSRQALKEYGDRDRFGDAVKRARARIEHQLEEGLLTRERQVAGHIFNLKNNFGWKDTQEVEHHHMLLAIGQPGSVPSQLEPPVIDAELVSPAVTAIPAQLEGETTPEQAHSLAASHNGASVNQGKSKPVNMLRKKA